MYYASNGIKTIVIRRDPSPESPRDSDYQSNLGKMVCWHRRHSLGDKHQYADSQEFAMQLASNYLNSGDIFHAVHAGQIDNCRLIPVSQKTINGKFIEPHYELQTYGGLPGYESWQGTGWCCTQDLRFITSGGQSLEDLLDTFRTRELLQLLDKSDQVVICPLYLYDHSGLSISTSSFAGRAHHVGWDSGQIGFIWMDKETAMKNLTNASDKIRLAQPITNDSHFHIPCGPDQDAEAAMAAKGYIPVRKEDILNPEANNLYGHWMENDVLFKSSNRLYVLEQGDHLESLEVRGPVATFNPKLEPLTDENWKARALQCLEGETVEYDNYLRGEIYFFEIYEGTDLMESSRGFNPGSEGIQDAVQDEFIDVVPGMSFEHSHDDSFDIESYFASHDFPALREKLTEDVKDFVIFESETSQVYPFAISAEEILANKDNILSHIVEELYSFHEDPDGTILYEVIESHAGKSRAVQPTLTVHDLDPNRDYTADELMGILKSKPSLADIILNAQARQPADEDNRNTRPQYHER